MRIITLTRCSMEERRSGEQDTLRFLEILLGTALMMCGTIQQANKDKPRRVRDSQKLGDEEERKNVVVPAKGIFGLFFVHKTSLDFVACVP